MSFLVCINSEKLDRGIFVIGQYQLPSHFRIYVITYTMVVLLDCKVFTLNWYLERESLVSVLSARFLAIYSFFFFIYKSLFTASYCILLNYTSIVVLCSTHQHTTPVMKVLKSKSFVFHSQIPRYR